MAEWQEYNGSDEQIAEMINAENGFIGNSEFSITKDPFVTRGCLDGEWLRKHLSDYKVTEYWLIPDDPMREMKIRQSLTGQPVWWRFSGTSFEPGVRCTTSPDWKIPNAEYSFTPFED